MRAIGSILSGNTYGIEIHHCVGRTAVHNKVHVGHWFILPLTHDEHEWIADSPWRRQLEKALWCLVVEKWGEIHKDRLYPFENDVFRAIMNYHR